LVWRLFSTALVSALAAGGALDVLTLLVARYGPQGGTGDSWWLRGNGAIIHFTSTVRAGQTVDILLDVTNPGLWMAHCHIAEHTESGMMFSFKVHPSPLNSLEPQPPR
jgi:FtsP/CotA-like multicopper oxidase with cupredoxin domain